MTVGAISKLGAIVAGTRNPLPLLLDYAGIKRRPYRVTSRSGVIFELRPKIGDRFGFYEVAIREDYFAARQLIEPGDTVIDVGANIGCFALLASRRVGPTGRVVALEPEARTFEQLQRNIALNHATNVTALRLAIGGRCGEVTLHISPESALFSSIYGHGDVGRADGRTQTVPMITLEELFNRHSIAHCRYLKLDCEGAEHDIVASMTSEVAGRIAGITMELHKVEGKDPAMIGQKLQDLGYVRVSAGGLPCYQRRAEG